MPTLFLCKPNLCKFTHIKSVKLCILLALCGDIEVNPGPEIKEKPLRFASFNARSLCNKGPVVSDFLHVNKIKLCGISETWLRPDATQSLLAELTPDDFTLINCPRPTGKGGGVAIMHDKLFESCKLDLPKFSSFEVVGAKIAAPGNDHFNFIVIYRPPRSSNTFLDEFTNEYD